MPALLTYKRIIVFFLVAALFNSCSEAYDPEIETQEPVVVVEGLITSLKETSFVKLSIAEPYNSVSKTRALTGAVVFIREQSGSTYIFEEQYDGYYIIDTASFKAVPGKIYTLHFETPAGDIYESSPQELLPPAGIDSIYGIMTEQEFIYVDIWGNTIGKMEKGAETFANFHSNSGPDTHFRLKTRMIIGYTYIDHSTVPFASIVYCWKKLDQDKALNITGIDNPISSDVMHQYSLYFFPFNSYLYGIESNQSLENWFLQIRQYTLNPDAYSYYREVNKQLSATGKIFDPSPPR
jgi:hypothetical protein